MNEPYLHREKQYLKINAELDTRFKEFDVIKTENCDQTKPRLNVFGSGAKGPKPLLQNTKPKRSETQLKATSNVKNSNEIKNVIEKDICDGPSNDVTDNPLITERSSRFIQPEHNVNGNNKSVQKLVEPSKNSDLSTILNHSSELTITNTTLSSSAEKAVKKNISSEGLTK